MITKGKWEISGESFSGYPKIASNGIDIACIYNEGPNRQQAPEHEAKANARLIAAAPKLLEACEGLYNFVQKYAPSGKADTMLGITKELIAEAEGE